AAHPGDRPVRAGRAARRGARHPTHRYGAGVARVSRPRPPAAAAPEPAQPAVAGAQSVVRDGTVAAAAQTRGGRPAENRLSRRCSAPCRFPAASSNLPWLVATGCSLGCVRGHTCRIPARESEVAPDRDELPAVLYLGRVA